MKKLTLDFDANAEVQAVCDFISQKWTTIPNLKDLVSEIQQKAFRIGSSWIEQYDTVNAAHDLRDLREEHLKKLLTPEEGEQIAYYDAYCSFIMQVSLKVRTLREVGMNYHSTWDYSREVNRLYASVYERYPELTTAKPQGWAELEKDYVDFAGQEEYNPRPDRELFQGVDSSALGFAGLTYTLALPYVMYSEFCQGRSASRELVGAIFSHFLTIRESLNGMQFDAELRRVMAEAPAEPVFYLKSFPSDNPFLQVIFKDWVQSDNQETLFKACVANRAATKELTPEEQAESERERAAYIEELIRSLKNPNPAEVQEATDRELKFKGLVFSQFATLRG